MSTRELVTLADVQHLIRDGYYWASRPGGKLPLAVAEPGPLIEHTVRLAGAEGLTLQELREIFHHLGKDRLDRGLAFARNAGLLDEQREKRPNRRGALQEQVVLRAHATHPAPSDRA